MAAKKKSSGRKQNNIMAVAGKMTKGKGCSKKGCK
jgi:hypothetical protein